MCDNFSLMNELYRSISVQRKQPDYKQNTRKNFMQNSMEQFMQIMKQTNVEMALELDRMPIGKFQCVTNSIFYVEV